MKIIFYLAISVLCYCGYPSNGGVLKTEVKENNPSHTQTKNDSSSEVQMSNVKAAVDGNDFKVEIYEDNKLVSLCFFYGGRLEKEITHNTETNTQESIIEYYYKKNGEFDKLKVTEGDSPDFFLDKLMSDFQVYRETLKSENIKLPLAAEVLFSEVSDLSNVLSVANGYDDFKKETITKENRKIIKFVGFNKNIRFYPSYITMFIPENTFIKGYQLTLTDNFPQKEVYKTDDGELVREYFYSNKKIVKVMNKFIDENDDSSFERRFEYQKLD